MKRYINHIIDALVKSSNDEKMSVKNTIVDSLRDIGRYEPIMVLTSCAKILEEEIKLPQPHRIVVLTIITRVLEVQLEAVDNDLSSRLITISLADMTKDKAVIPDWQGQASSVLVALGRRYPKQIVDRLLQLFGPGEVPHYFVVKTLADLAIANPVNVVPLLADVLSRMTPVLASIKLEDMKWVFAYAIGHFCDAMISYKADTNNTGMPITQFSPQIYTAFELFLTTWIIQKNRLVRLATIQSIGSMCNIMTPEQFEGQLQKLVTTFLNLYKTEEEEDHLQITQGFYNILSVAARTTRLPLEPHIQKIMTELFPFITKPIDYTISGAVKNYNELLRCFEVVGIAFIDTLLTFLLQKLENRTNSIRYGSVIIIKHCVTRIQPQLQEKKEIIVAGLQTLVQNENDYLVKKSLAQLVIVMGAQGYLSLGGGEQLIEFVILNSSIGDKEIEDYNEKQRAIQERKKKTRKKKKKY